MRLLVNAYAAFIQDAAGLSGTRWTDMIRAEIREQVPQVFKHEVTIRKPIGRNERLAQHRQIVLDIVAKTKDPKEQRALWTEKTGLRDTAFYERKGEVDPSE